MTVKYSPKNSTIVLEFQTPSHEYTFNEQMKYSDIALPCLNIQFSSG